MSAPFVGQGIPSVRRTGHCIATHSGFLWPMDLQPNEIDVVQLGMALGNTCRFNGWCPFYSVAQHSVLVSRLLPPDLKLWGLLHDAAEPYFAGDLSRPLKETLKSLRLRRIEDRILKVIATRFGLEWPIPAAVKHADNLALCTEAHRFFGPKVLTDWFWSDGVHPQDVTIQPEGPEESGMEWIRHFRLVADRFPEVK